MARSPCKRISQLRGIAVDNKIKFGTTQLSIPHQPRNLFKFKFNSYNICIHSCCLPCNYGTKPFGILQMGN